MDIYSLNQWTLCGWQPDMWRFFKLSETGATPTMEQQPITVSLPISVHEALRQSKLLPDYYNNHNSRLCEWVEHRHWMFQCCIDIPPIDIGNYNLICPGLDGAGCVMLNDEIIGSFNNSHIQHEFQMDLKEGKHWVRIVFYCPPTWLGQMGWTSQIPVTKTRFYYTWDWVPRLVQTGITGLPFMQKRNVPSCKIKDLRTSCDWKTRKGKIFLRGWIENTDHVTVFLFHDGKEIERVNLNSEMLRSGYSFDLDSVKLWFPRGTGESVTYELQIKLDNMVLSKRTLGFREIHWRPCLNAPANADHWICEINGTALFLQGINWTPIRPLTADVKWSEYELRLKQYEKMGINLFRLWGGASRESDEFYEYCNLNGFLVWQEFPLCSSGLDNLPPEDTRTLHDMLQIANEYISGLSSHPSLFLWSGGNELMADAKKPCQTTDFPILAMLRGLLAERDPERRFVPTSASGPCEWGIEEQFGQNQHYDVHGPWRIETMEKWYQYWNKDDALFRSEVGCCSASPLPIIRKYADKLDHSVTESSAFWNSPMGFWNETAQFAAEHGDIPQNLDEYVKWTELRQYNALGYAAWCCKRRFPSCGGIIIWMGHDCFPCSANTAILDFESNFKSGAYALEKIFTNSVEYWRSNQFDIQSNFLASEHD